MLTFLRWLWGCWHDWQMWTHLRVDGDAMQQRFCNKCGKRVVRYVDAPI